MATGKYELQEQPAAPTERDEDSTKSPAGPIRVRIDVGQQTDTYQPGSRFGRYEIITLVARGGMGDVYKARDSRLKRDVAIKVLPQDVADDPTARRRLEREAQAAASLAHPNIVSVFDLENQGGTILLVTEFVPGESLRRHLHRSHVPLKTVLNWSGQIAAGVAAAHEKGIVHRDLKPENILVTPDNHLKILDFGIAKRSPTVVDDTPSGSVQDTQPGAVLGTARYMSPEQLRGPIVGTPSDVFALGLVFHELLTGKPVFGQRELMDIVAAVSSHRKYQRPQVKQRDAARFVRLIARCLAQQPSARPTALEVEADLKRLARAEVSDPRTHTRRGSARTAVSGEARQAWLKARVLLDSQLEDWCAESFAALEKALELSPSFLDARIELSRWYVLAAVRGEIPLQTGLSKAAREAEQAVTLEPHSPEALIALAQAYYTQRRLDEAEKLCQQVIAKNPAHTAALCAYSELLSMVGRHAEALEHVNRAVVHESLHAMVHCRKAAALFCARRFEECVDCCTRALRFSPTTSGLHYFAGTAMLMLGQWDEAAGYLSRGIKLEPNAPVHTAALAVAWHKAGRISDSQQLISQLEEHDVDPAIRAEAYAGVGRLDDALTCLELAFRRDSPHVLGIAVNALLDPIRNHPRLQRLARALGLPAPAAIASRNADGDDAAAHPAAAARQRLLWLDR